VDRVALLRAIADGGAAGSALAARFGVSRAAVWKAVEALRAEGLGIEGAAGEGYRLVSRAGFGPISLGWALDRPVHYFERCGSTNAEARRLLQDQPEADLLVVADAQDAGRGRLGRSWQAEPGENLLFSLVLRPRVVPQQAATCVLAWAAAMAEVLDCSVKWPNDLVTPGGKKLGGILAELQAEAETVRSVILGVGINVNQQAFPDLPLATSIAQQTGSAQDRADLLARLVTAVEAVPTTGGPCLDVWRARSHTLGRQVAVGDVQGRAERIRDDGALIIDGVAVLAGDVQLLAEPGGTG
jgi:BirA family biotin operon repressor/biotin-[acetyl-CoA-carboxylase] ligase